MNKVSQIILGSFITLGSLFAPVGEAQARTQCYDYPQGATVCFKDNGAYSSDVIGIFAADGRESFMNIVCDGRGGNRWEAKGFMTQEYYQYVANDWCDDYRS